jgi:hypothetical protein
VRHEVAGVSVMRNTKLRHDLLFCQQSPTRTGVPGNGEVGSSGDNATSSPGMAAKARADAATASLTAVGSQERGHGECNVKCR